MAIDQLRKSARLKKEKLQAEMNAIAEARRMEAVKKSNKELATEIVRRLSGANNERNSDMALSQHDAMQLAIAQDQLAVRRKFIETTLSDIPSTYSDLLPMTGDLGQLRAEAARLREQCKKDFAPIIEAEKIRVDAEQRAALKARLLAQGESEAVAEMASQMRLPGDLGYDAIGEVGKQVEAAQSQPAASQK